MVREFLQKFKDPKFLLKIAIIAIVYFVTAKFGLSLSYSYKQVTLVWPPSGISLAILLLYGLDLWPGILIGAFVANLTTSETVTIASGIALGNTLEAYIAAFLLTRFHFSKQFARVKDVLLFVVCAALFSTAISATIGTSSLIRGGIGSWNNFFPVWLNWWAGDFVGDMVFAPAILIWSQISKFKFNIFSLLEGLILLVLLVVLSLAIFTGSISTIPHDFQVQFKYIMFPFLLWASYRFKQKGSTFGILIVTAIGIWGAITGSGPFVVMDDPEKSLLFLDAFVVAIALTFLVFSSIIQERDAADDRVEASEKRFKSLIENSADAIILIDQTANITFASQSVKRVLGYEPEELVGTNGFNIVYPEDIPLSRKSLGEVVASPGKTIRLENRLILKSGAIHWMEVEGKNLIEDPDVNGIIVNFRDINERKQLDQVKSEFVSLSAHQLRSPLGVIRWYTESLMSEKTFPSKLKSYLSEIYTAFLNMNETVNLLLDVSRFELGTMTLNRESVDLNLIVQNVLEGRKKQINDKKLKITVAGDKIPEILGDPKLIRVIIENLVSNAIKYTPPEGKIDITLASQKENILFKITDTGAGIPIEEQDKIFTKLYRGSNVRKVEPSGLGLGLYLIRLIIDLKGGKIWFESEEGKGTTFFVEFPLKIKTPQK
jgi:PAS domain S-box-containing protein